MRDMRPDSIYTIGYCSSHLLTVLLASFIVLGVSAPQVALRVSISIDLDFLTRRSAVATTATPASAPAILTRDHSGVRDVLGSKAAQTQYSRRKIAKRG